MLTVTIQGPNGERLAVLRVYNDGTGTREVGSYECHLETHDEQRRHWRLAGYQRSRGAVSLVAAALHAYTSPETADDVASAGIVMESPACPLCESADVVGVGTRSEEISFYECQRCGHDFTTT